MTLGEREIADLRTDAEELLPATGRIWTKTSTPSEGSGQRDTYLSLAGDFSCSVEPAGGGEGDASPGDQTEQRSTHLISIPADVPEPSESDIVEIDEIGAFEINLVRKRTYLFLRRLEVIETRQELGS